jgi:hypothetical protein
MRRREPRGRYVGPAELLTDGDKLADVDVSLHGWVTLIADGNEPPIEGTKGWDGTVAGLSGDQRVAALRHQITVRTPDGREAQAVLRTQTDLVGSGPPPFDM